MAMYFSCAIGFILYIIYTVKSFNGRNVKGVFVKTFVSYFFIITAALAIAANPAQWLYGLLILLGGIMGLMGDVYLDQKYIYPDDKDSYLSMGFLSFSIGHILYIVAIFKYAELSAKDLIIPVVFTVFFPLINLALSKPLQQDFGKFKLIVTLYGGVIAFMFGSSIAAYIKTKSSAFLIFTIAGVFFFVSDIILSAMYFTVGKDKNTKLRFVLNHGTYYIAQYLIALTPAFVGLE